MNPSDPGPDSPAETFWRRLAGGVRRVQQRADWPEFVGPGWVDSIMAAAVTDRFHAKQGRSTGRWVLHAGNRRLAVYLKRHYQLPRWRGLMAAVWPGAAWSPALQEWQHLEWARAQGMPVPAPVAVGEYVGPWGRLQSFLAVEELAGMLPLHEAIPAAAAHLAPDPFARWKRGLAHEMARLVRGLHNRRRFHKDLYLCHFYIPAADTEVLPAWRGHVHLIDLHRLAHHPWTWWLWQAKDLAELLYSSDVAGVDDRDRLRFWRLYLGPTTQNRTARWLRAAVLAKWRRYRRHNARRKAA
jgi:heptose I phosphotransferase